MCKFNNIPGSDTQLSVVSSLPAMGWSQGSPLHLLFADPVLPFGGSYWKYAASYPPLSLTISEAGQAGAFYLLFFFTLQTGSRLWFQLAVCVHMLLWVPLGKHPNSFPCSQGWALCLLTVDAGLCVLSSASSYFLLIFYLRRWCFTVVFFSFFNWTKLHCLSKSLLLVFGL